MTQEAKLVFDLEDISRIRVGCTKCGMKFAIPLKHTCEKTPTLKADCPSCGFSRAGRVDRESDLLIRLRNLVRSPDDNPAVRLCIEVDDPHYHGFGRRDEDRQA